MKLSKFGVLSCALLMGQALSSYACEPQDHQPQARTLAQTALHDAHDDLTFKPLELFSLKDPAKHQRLAVTTNLLNAMLVKGGIDFTARTALFLDYAKTLDALRQDDLAQSDAQNPLNKIALPDLIKQQKRRVVLGLLQSSPSPRVFADLFDDYIVPAGLERRLLGAILRRRPDLEHKNVKMMLSWCAEYALFSKKLACIGAMHQTKSTLDAINLFHLTFNGAFRRNKEISYPAHPEDFSLFTGEISECGSEMSDLKHERNMSFISGFNEIRVATELFFDDVIPIFISPSSSIEERLFAAMRLGNVLDAEHEFPILSGTSMRRSCIKLAKWLSLYFYDYCPVIHVDQYNPDLDAKHNLSNLSHFELGSMLLGQVFLLSKSVLEYLGHGDFLIEQDKLNETAGRRLFITLLRYKLSSVSDPDERDMLLLQASISLRNFRSSLEPADNQFISSIQDQGMGAYALKYMGTPPARIEDILRDTPKHIAFLEQQIACSNDENKQYLQFLLARCHYDLSQLYVGMRVPNLSRDESLKKELFHLKSAIKELCSNPDVVNEYAYALIATGYFEEATQVVFQYSRMLNQSGYFKNLMLILKEKIFEKFIAENDVKFIDIFIGIIKKRMNDHFEETKKCVSHKGLPPRILAALREEQKQLKIQREEAQKATQNPGFSSSSSSSGPQEKGKQKDNQVSADDSPTPQDLSHMILNQGSAAKLKKRRGVKAVVQSPDQEAPSSASSSSSTSPSQEDVTLDIVERQNEIIDELNSRQLAILERFFVPILQPDGKKSDRQQHIRMDEFQLLMDGLTDTGLRQNGTSHIKSELVTPGRRAPMINGFADNLATVAKRKILPPYIIREMREKFLALGLYPQSVAEALGLKTANVMARNLCQAKKDKTKGN